MESLLFTENRIITHQLVRNVAIGVTLMEIAGAITYVVNGAVTSRFLGSTALAANGMAGICFTIFAMISGIIAAGVSQICSKEIGKGNIEKSNKVFSMALYLATVISVLIAIIGVIFSVQVANLIGASKSNNPELFNYANMYIKGFFIGAPGHILMAILIPEAQICGKNKTILSSIIVLTIVNVILDFANVLLFNGGMFGMGIATSISYYSGFLVLALSFRNNKLFKIDFKNPDFSSLPEMMKIGMPRATKRIGNIVRPLIINRLILLAGGVVAMSAFSVEQNVRYVVESVGVGIGGSIFLLGGIFLGEKDYSMVKSCCKVCIQYIILGVGGLAVVYFFAAPYLTKIYLPASSESYKWAVQVLRCHAVSLPFLAYNEFYQNLIQAEEKYLLTHIHTLLNKLVIIVVLSFALKPIMGVLGLWIAIPLSEILLVVAVIVLKGIKNLREHNPDGFFALVDKNESDPSKEINLHISNKNEIEAIIEKIKEFCTINGLNSNHLYYLELFIEELVVIIFDKGMADPLTNSIDIRICIDDNVLVIRTRDNGKSLSAMDRLEIYDNSQDDEYLGMKMIYKLSSSIKYVTIMEINNFIVKLPLN